MYIYMFNITHYLLVLICTYPVKKSIILILKYYSDNITHESKNHVSYTYIYVMPTGMEEAPKAALNIHCLQRGGGVALT